ncbi:transposase [Prosthecomicrobium hirschii]|uniref:transposase n=1 Tax=Prosthecodimorpha hirschii TaxID=665126 RepID=UPI003B8A74AA
MRRRCKGGTPRQGRGRSRGGFSTKIHLPTNGEGLPVAVEIAPGPTSDYTGAVPLLDADGPEPRGVIADRGYDADHLRETMHARSITPVTPSRRNRRVQIVIDGHIYALRNRIERYINNETCVRLA